MAATDPRWRQLRAAFSAELEERTRALNQLLLCLERGDGDDRARGESFDALFREAHSLKGAARAVELDQIERLVHALESALDGARRGGRQPTGAWFDAVYRAVDTLGALDRSAREGDGSPPDLADVLAGLDVDGSETGGVPAPPTGTGAPVSDERLRQAKAPASGLPEAAPSALSQQPATTPSFNAAQRDASARASGESVRVAVDKLDRLLAQTGELAVTEVRIDQRRRELHGLRQDLGDWRREWRHARGLRAGLRGAIASITHRDDSAAAGGQAGTDGTLGREVEALLRFTERAEQRVQAILQRVEEMSGQLRHDTAQLSQVTRAIEDEVMAVRLLPVVSILGPFERMVRDLTRELGKEARLVFEGGETEVDRKILEQIRDPLMHMLRNAVDHGIERPDEREASGKPRAGMIRVAATQRGSVIEIELSDDGVGLDSSRLRQTAISKGLLSEEQTAALDDRSALELIFRPGFSTSTSITETSGRGVGMDVVREHVARLNGQVEVSSAPGQGTRFTLSVPLTLATSRAILVEQGGQLFAIPAAMVERTAQVRERQLVSLEGRRAVEIEGHPVAVVELASALERQALDGNGSDPDGWRPFFVLRQADRRVALLVDRLVGEQEIVVKSLGWPLRRVRNVGGATVLSGGQVVVILNPSDLLKTASRLQQSIGAVASPVTQPEQRRQRVLVVDDSLTTRTLERSILEAAGYDVAVATDGMEALTVLRAEPIDLVVSDVDMPRLDGFGLTAELRRDQKLRQLPVVLVTSLDAREHRERGVAVGADAYIVKSGFDQGQLLETIRRLL